MQGRPKYKPRGIEKDARSESGRIGVQRKKRYKVSRYVDPRHLAVAISVFQRLFFEGEHPRAYAVCAGLRRARRLRALSISICALRRFHGFFRPSSTSLWSRLCFLQRVRTDTFSLRRRWAPRQCVRRSGEQIPFAQTFSGCFQRRQALVTGAWWLASMSQCKERRSRGIVSVRETQAACSDFPVAFAHAGVVPLLALQHDGASARHLVAHVKHVVDGALGRLEGVVGAEQRRHDRSTRP